ALSSGLPGTTAGPETPPFARCAIESSSRLPPAFTPVWQRAQDVFRMVETDSGPACAAIGTTAKTTKRWSLNMAIRDTSERLQGVFRALWHVSPATWDQRFSSWALIGAPAF